MKGRIIDKSNGFYVDLFTYSKHPDHEGWLKRDHDEDFGGFKFPIDYLFPLQEKEFLGHQVMVPAQIEKFLLQEYHSLEIPLTPWKWMFYTAASTFSIILAFAALILSGDWIACIFIAMLTLWLRGGVQDLPIDLVHSCCAFQQ